MSGILSSLFGGLNGGRASTAAVRVAQLHEALAADPTTVVIDVRTPGEWSEGHVPNAVHIPLDQLGQRLAEVKAFEGRPIYMICRSGGRSGQAQAMLAQAGIPTTNVSGGTMAWAGAGYPLA